MNDHITVLSIESDKMKNGCTLPSMVAESVTYVFFNAKNAV